MTELMTRDEAVDCAEHAFKAGFEAGSRGDAKDDTAWIADMIDEVRQPTVEQQSLDALENAVLDLIENLFFENPYNGDQIEDEFWGDVAFHHGKHIAERALFASALVVANRQEENLIDLLNSKATNKGPLPTKEKASD